MENPEEILHSLEEFSKMKPKDIPRELEEYLCFVAKTGDPVYQWSSIKSLFREKLINVITEFYESCPSVEIPPCPNVEIFNYDIMKNFILEKLDTFASAPFTVQRICELLTTPRKEYNRIDKYMRALEKNILVVSTMEPGNRRNTENGESIMNGIESDHVPEPGNEINVEEMDESPSWSVHIQTETVIPTTSISDIKEDEIQHNNVTSSPFSSLKISHTETTTVSQDNGISCTIVDEQQFVSIESVQSNAEQSAEEPEAVKEESVTITAVSVSLTSVQPNTTETIPSIDSVLKECGDHDTNNTAEEKQEDQPQEPIKLLQNQESEVQIDEVLPFPSESSENVPKPDQSSPQNEEEPSNPSESEGIENISPETSTSAPDTLDLEKTPEIKNPLAENDVDLEAPKESLQEESESKTEEKIQIESQEVTSLSKVEEEEKSETILDTTTETLTPLAEESIKPAEAVEKIEDTPEVSTIEDTKPHEATEISSSQSIEDVKETQMEKELDKTDNEITSSKEENNIDVTASEEVKVQIEESVGEKTIEDVPDTSTPMEVDSTEKIEEKPESTEDISSVNSSVDDLVAQSSEL